MIRLILILIATLIFFFNNTVFAATYLMPEPGNDIIGQNLTIQIKKGDSWNGLAKRYGLSIHELLEANPHLGSGKLKIGTTVLIPAQFVLPKYRKGIVINLPELRLYYFTPNGKYVKTYPVGLGRKEWRTPTTSTAVIDKKVDPDWNVPESIKDYMWETYGKLLPDVIPGGTPKNPLGHRALYLGKNGYLIHGNNNPNSIGKFVSSGCIRMNNTDVEELYPHVKVGTPVYILNLSQKAGWRNGMLYLESHIPVNLPEQDTSQLNNDAVDIAIRDAVNMQTANINWEIADQVASERTGVPKAIGTAS